MNLRRVLRIGAAVLTICAAALGADAHEVRPAYLQIEEVSPGHFDALWKQPSNGTLAVRLEPVLSNGLLAAPPTETFAANSFAIRRWHDRPVSVDSFDGATLRIEGLSSTITDALVTISFRSGQQIETILRPQSPELKLHLTGTGKTSVPTYFALGVEHILTGIDHLSFVLALILLVSGWVRLLKTITAFTIAHSLTLGAAALGYVHLSPPVIESLVALSILFVAVELAKTWRQIPSLTARYPWLIAFTFGLLHGFAFAGSLAEIGLPPHNIPAALLLFNLGVEAGQLLFVAAVFVILAVLRRLSWQPATPLRWTAPYGIGTAATYWMLERIHVLVG